MVQDTGKGKGIWLLANRNSGVMQHIPQQLPLAHHPKSSLPTYRYCSVVSLLEQLDPEDEGTTTFQNTGNYHMK
jgi:hypothetical protein